MTLASPPAAKVRSVADQLINELHLAGIEVVFGVHGANIEDLFDAAIRAGLTVVIAKHEFAAGAMADGVARMTGRRAAVLTTSGGGAMNVVAALAESYDSRVPVLAVIGSAPAITVGNGGFQDMRAHPDTVDISAVLSGVTGSTEFVESPAELSPAIRRALDVLDNDLPAALVLAKDVQAAPADPSGAPLAAVPVSRSAGAADDESEQAAVVAELADAISGHLGVGDICLWAGEEASRREVGDEIAVLADLLGAAVVVSPVAGMLRGTDALGSPGSWDIARRTARSPTRRSGWQSARGCH